MSNMKENTMDKMTDKLRKWDILTVDCIKNKPRSLTV